MSGPSFPFSFTSGQGSVMRVIHTIPIAQIEHGELPKTKKVIEFMSHMHHRGLIFPPVKVERIANNRYRLKDGRNRLAAHVYLGKTEIRATYGIKEDPRPDKPLVTKEEQS